MQPGQHQGHLFQQAMLRPVRPAYAQVAEQILGLILEGKLSPGDRLPVEPALAAAFGVSRSTVREAVRSLASRHVLATHRGGAGGTFVTSPGRADVAEYLATTLSLFSSAESLSVDVFLEAREVLEVRAAELATARRTPDFVERLRSTLPAPEDIDLHHQFEGNLNFHVVLVEGSQNALMELLARPIFAILRTRFLRDKAPPEFWKTVDHDHHAIAEAVERGDSSRAGAEMASHLERLRSTYIAIDQLRLTD